MRRTAAPVTKFAAVLMAAAGWLSFSILSASAAGSMGLDEILLAVSKEPELVSEIRQELTKNNLKVNDVGCGGARHGNQWKYLGGGRAAPYECEIGQRTLSIEADRIYYDRSGRSLGDIDKADPKRAMTFRESKIRWTWTP